MSPPVALVTDRRVFSTTTSPMKPSGRGCSFSWISARHPKSLQTFYSLAISEAPTVSSAPPKIRVCERAWEVPTKLISHSPWHTAGPHFPAFFAASHRSSSGQWKVGIFHLPGLAHKNLTHLPLFLFPDMITGHKGGNGSATREQSPTP